MRVQAVFGCSNVRVCHVKIDLENVLDWGGFAMHIAVCFFKNEIFFLYPASHIKNTCFGFIYTVHNSFNYYIIHCNISCLLLSNCIIKICTVYWFHRTDYIDILLRIQTYSLPYKKYKVHEYVTFILHTVKKMFSSPWLSIDFATGC